MTMNSLSIIVFDPIIAFIFGSIAASIVGHLIWLEVSQHRRSHAFRHIAYKFGLKFDETRLRFWRFLAVDPVRGDKPFIWRSLAGSINGRSVVVQDVERCGVMPHPWWYRTSPAAPLGVFGVSSGTEVVIDGTVSNAEPPMHPLFYNRFVSVGQIENILADIANGIEPRGCHSPH